MIRKLLSVLLLGITLTAQAETRYVSDALEIDMRSGTSNQHRILRMLESGTALEILEDDKASGYSHVRTPSGAEGWILSRYLMTTAPAGQRLAETEKKLAELELQSRQRMAKLSESDKEFINVTEELTRVKDENLKLAKQLADIQRTASSALAIDAENQELKNSLMQMERGQETLRQENAALHDRTARDWFMIGAGVMIVGIVLGLILPRIRMRKRSSWGSL
ncbi:MAG: TIGR04211 family SH3 domain-containing protein [Gammaproteobacteria bacterium]|nr:TIGR04211 family SH3 domain-containing protein [Gammaproteobacteria bacterium]